MIVLWIGRVATEKSYQWKSQRSKAGDKCDNLNAEICKQTNFFWNEPIVTRIFYPNFAPLLSLFLCLKNCSVVTDLSIMYCLNQMAPRSRTFYNQLELKWYRWIFHFKFHTSHVQPFYDNGKPQINDYLIFVLSNYKAE